MTIDTELDEEAFAKALADEDEGRRLLVLQALQECDRRGPLPQRVLEPLLDCLGSGRKAVQRSAAEVLALWSRATPEIRDRLVERLDAPQRQSRWGAAFALDKMGPEPASLGVLLDALGEPDGDVRWAAEGILVRLVHRHPHTAARLSALVETGSASQRKMVLYALRDVGEATPRLREIMIAQLWHEEPEVRLAAISALARLFADDEAVVGPVVAVARADSQPGIRRAAVSALVKLRPAFGGEEAARVLEQAAAGDDPGLRRAALGARAKRRGGA